jgi:hypothetical protein
MEKSSTDAADADLIGKRIPPIEATSVEPCLIQTAKKLNFRAHEVETLARIYGRLMTGGRNEHR